MLNEDEHLVLILGKLWYIGNEAEAAAAFPHIVNIT